VVTGPTGRSARRCRTASEDTTGRLIRSQGHRRWPAYVPPAAIAHSLTTAFIPKAMSSQRRTAPTCGNRKTSHLSSHPTEDVTAALERVWSGQPRPTYSGRDRGDKKCRTPVMQPLSEKQPARPDEAARGSSCGESCRDARNAGVQRRRSTGGSAPSAVTDRSRSEVSKWSRNHGCSAHVAQPVPAGARNILGATAPPMCRRSIA
jgi:hypothetical protein